MQKPDGLTQGGTNMLGKIDRVDIRSIWKNEAADFSKWLAEDANLSMLGDEIGIRMHLIRREAAVGAFSVDILAEEETTGHKVVIENQLEQTDHDHFGKLFTYGSGYDAGILIWICKDVREEHRKAIDWLNDRTDNTLHIFLIKREAWRIGDSLPAPKFEVVCSPNDWAKTVKDTATGGRLSETNMLQLNFWTDFNTYVQANHGQLKLRKPQPQHWYDVTIEGVPATKAHLGLTAAFAKGFIRCEFYIPDDKALYHEMCQHRAEIEAELGLELAWEELPKAKASTIFVKKENVKVRDRRTWEGCHKWFMETATAFAQVFPKYYAK